MSIKVNNIILDIDEDETLIRKRAAKKLKISEKDIQFIKIIKQSIDARKKDIIKFNYSVEICCNSEEKLVSKSVDRDVIFETEMQSEKLEFGLVPMKHRPIIVGMGPAGLFAGLIMAQNGYKPIIIERGQCVEERTETVNYFWKTGKLNTESNVQFGEGGAGTFSDGKLTTRIKDKRCDFVLHEFVRNGAPEEIQYKGKPHIGTDILKNVVSNIRKEIIRLGGEVLFNSKLEEISVKNGKLAAIKVNGTEIACEDLILSIGHSSRDTYSMLQKIGVALSPKPFAIGVRVEHLQEMIDKSQYGRFAGHPRLKAADYRLTHTAKSTGRAVYSFCMCPGGVVVAAASEDGRLVTNGMSYYNRDLVNANSAIVVSVAPEDFEGSSPLRGMEFQRNYEKLAYEIGGGGFSAPVQLIEDFLKDTVTTKIGSVTPSYAPGFNFKDMRKCLPNYITESLKEGFVAFDSKIKGFACSGGIMTGIETRTSAPVRIERNEKLMSVNVEGLYPAGEGAGFAGGIISAAVDGIKCAEMIMKSAAPAK